jgi:predicted DNA-binding transcriptional regulator AlpA
MVPENKNELKKSGCPPLRSLPPPRTSRQDRYAAIVCPMAELTLAEIRRAFEPVADKYPPVLSLEQAAEIAGLAPSTMQRLVSEGQFKNSVKRGKPLRFWRDRFVQEAMR